MTGRGRLPSAVFVDRDGTLIEDPGYLSDPARVRPLPGALEAVARLNRAGVPVVVVTNQSGIGRGLYNEADFRSVQAELERRLARAGGRFDAVYHCPHDPRRGPCGCRKPEMGLHRRAARELGIDLSRALYVGDRLRDVTPAAATGGRGLLLVGRAGGRYDGPLPPGVEVAPDLATGISRILGASGDPSPARDEGA